MDRHDPVADLLTVRPTAYHGPKETAVPLEAIAREDDPGVYLTMIEEDTSGLAGKGDLQEPPHLTRQCSAHIS